MRALQLVSEREVKVTDVAPPPPPGEGEVQLKPRVVALNHIDVWGWRGMAFAKRNLPMTVGAEASAEVVAIGPGVTGLKTGDLVSIYGAPTCGLCRPCRQGWDNHCENPKGGPWLPFRWLCPGAGQHAGPKSDPCATRR